MRKLMYVAEEKMNGAYLSVKNRAGMLLTKRREGISTLVIVLLLIVVAVGLTALFKTQITSLMNSIFKEMNSKVTSSLFSEPAVN